MTRSGTWKVDWWESWSSPAGLWDPGPQLLTPSYRSSVLSFTLWCIHMAGVSHGSPSSKGFPGEQRAYMSLGYPSTQVITLHCKVDSLPLDCQGSPDWELLDDGIPDTPLMCLRRLGCWKNWRIAISGVWSYFWRHSSSVGLGWRPKNVCFLQAPRWCCKSA